ncbi:MAG: hypothetical protein Q7S64_02185 [bacterium]|nr:hypothetical protein [bacterium]
MSSSANLALYYERLDRAYGIGLLLRWVPFVRLVGLNGSMITGTMKPSSDIDFYVATAPERLYTTRLLVVLVVQLTGWRRYGSKIRGRICLNRFATTAALEITPHNNYHAQVFSGLAPLYAHHQTYRAYFDANEWMEYNFYRRRVHRTERLAPNLAQFSRRLYEGLLSGWLGDFVEAKLARWQQRRILADPRTSAARGRVRVSQEELCLHPLK